MLFVWALGGVIVVLASAILIASRGSRHVFFSAVLVSCAGTTLWLLQGAGLPAPRSVVVVYGAWASKPALEEALGALDATTSTTFLEISLGEEQLERVAEWTTAGRALSLLAGGTLDGRFVAHHGTGTGSAWGERLFRHCREIL